jgi:pimeloyl-ACP methyl ester carboxylesterase
VIDPPGRLVDVGGFRLHIRCDGTGTPAVVFDAALGGSSISWTLVQPAIAHVAQACTYDRAGFGWSDAGPMPRTAARAAAELRDLLHRAGVPPPYLLVGHSFGGLVMRIFATRYRSETCGLVLVDPAHPEDWVKPAPKEQRQIARGLRLCRHGALATRFGLARIVAALVSFGALGPARALVGLVSRGGFTRDDEAILAPIWKLPPATRPPLRYFWTQRKFFDALGSQIQSICTSAAEVLDASAAGYGDLPLVTISSTNPGEYRLRQQEALARLSNRGEHIIAPNSGHWVPLDEPEIVIDSILRMVSTVRHSCR